MNGKVKNEDNLSVECLNPFVHHLELESTYEKIKTAIFTVLLLPIRVFVICCLVVTAWLMACLGLWGLTEADLRSKPITGWRRSLRNGVAVVIRLIFTAGGFHWVRQKGHLADPREARVLVLAPHSSFFDTLAYIMVGVPSVVAKAETASIPIFGKLINFTQPVYVWREDPNSRQNTIKEIIDRANSDQDWSQILIFPEGTCTNRSCLITFKPGAFYPGVPIQPVCIRYPNKLDTVTWTWEGPGALKLLWLTLSQMHSYCEIEFLPVYHPSEAEKKDPKLYASNVRQLMAKALGIPVSDYTYDDCRVISRAKQMNLPFASGLVEAQKLRHKLGLDSSDTEERILNSTHVLCNDCSQLSYPEFANILQIPMTDPALQQLFRLYDKDSTGVIDFREYLFGILVISKAENNLEMLEIAFKIFDHSGRGHLNKYDFIQALKHTLNMNDDDTLYIFSQIAKNGKKFVSIDDFRKYAKSKAEFSSLFSLSKEEKSILKSDNNKLD